MVFIRRYQAFSMAIWNDTPLPYNRTWVATGGVLFNRAPRFSDGNMRPVWKGAGRLSKKHNETQRFTLVFQIPIVSRCWATNTYTHIRTFWGSKHRSSQGISRILEGLSNNSAHSAQAKMAISRGDMLEIFKHPSIKLKQIQENDFKCHHWFVKSFKGSISDESSQHHHHLPKIDTSILRHLGRFVFFPKTVFFPLLGPGWINTRACRSATQFFAFSLGSGNKATDMFTDFFPHFVEFCGTWVNVSNVFCFEKISVAKFAMFINIGYGKAGAPWRESQWIAQILRYRYQVIDGFSCLHKRTRWWFQVFLIFTPIVG